MVWWVHFFLVMSIIAAIPFTKFRHLFTTPINYLFADLREKGSHRDDQPRGRGC